MSECDAYKLIEEFIKKSSDFQNVSLNTTNFDTLPTLMTIDSTSESYSSSSSSFISSYLGVHKCQKELTILETPPETPEQVKQIQLPYQHQQQHQQQQQQHDDTPIQKPNRPYSYYVATNFHPLDLSVLTQETESDDTKLEETIVDKPVKKRVNKKKQDENKRLSMSLTDIKVGKLDKIESTKKTNSFFKLSKKSKSNQNNLEKTNEEDFEETDDDTFLKSSTNAFKRSFIFNATMPARISSKNKSNNTNTTTTTTATTPMSTTNTDNHHHSKINRFFRNLFRINDKPAKENDFEPSHTNFKFARLFSFRHHNNESTKNFRYKYSVPTGIKTCESTSTNSCRTNSTSTNGTTCPLQLVVTDEQPSKIILPQIKIDYNLITDQQHSPESSDVSDLTESFNKMNSMDSLEILKEKFYSEVADRLKKIASCTNSSTNFSHEKSSLSSIDLIDIPYIDDETDEQTDDNNLYSYTSSDLNFSQNSSRLIKTDMSDLIIDQNRLYEFIQNASYSKFDELAMNYLNKYDSVWNKIAILFELINRCVHIVTNSSPNFNQILVSKLKEIAANYIHDRYCDWIYKNGGWKSVPDIISLPRENSERIH